MPFYMAVNLWKNEDVGVAAGSRPSPLRFEGQREQDTTKLVRREWPDRAIQLLLDAGTFDLNSLRYLIQTS
jgi:hypothetical protein